MCDFIFLKRGKGPGTTLVGNVKFLRRLSLVTTNPWTQLPNPNTQPVKLATHTDIPSTDHSGSGSRMIPLFMNGSILRRAMAVHPLVYPTWPIPRCLSSPQDGPFQRQAHAVFDLDHQRGIPWTRAGYAGYAATLSWTELTILRCGTDKKITGVLCSYQISAPHRNGDSKMLLAWIKAKKTDQGYQFGTTSDQMLATSNEDSGPALIPWKKKKTLGLWAGSRPFRSNPILTVEYSSSSSPPTTTIIIPSYHDFFQQYSYIWIKYMIH